MSAGLPEGGDAGRDRDRRPYRMKDLCELTGLPRQAIHFYIQQGLLPAGHKTGRNMAWYGEEHLERLRLVRKLQRERFLPLRAIRALLDGRDEQFTPEQLQFLRDVKTELATSLAEGADGARETLDATVLLEENGISIGELERMVDIGLLGATVEEGGRVLLATEDRWVIECVGRMRAAGLTPELGFTVDDLERYVESLNELLHGDAAAISKRVSHLPPATVARMIERVIPVIHDFMTRYHASRVRDFFSTM